MSSNTTPSDFQGWVAHGLSAAEGNMQWGPYMPKSFAGTDIESSISHCGVCSTDISVLHAGLGPVNYPLVVGHEIIGKVTRVGKDVKDLIEQESNCTALIVTYNGKYASGDKTYGGYAELWRGPAAFAVPIPEGLPSEVAAPLLCGGVTVYNALIAYGAGPGKRVSVVGVGGLGHFAILFAKALGCEKVVAISRSSSKKADAHELGADEFIATGEESDWVTKNNASLDHFISTAAGTFPLDQHLCLLGVNSTFVQVGTAGGSLSFPVGLMLYRNLKIAGSLIGTRKQIRAMLELAKKTDRKAWIQVRPISEANQVIVDFQKGLPRYRYVLKN